MASRAAARIDFVGVARRSGPPRFEGGLDRHAARHLAGGVTAETVGDDEQRAAIPRVVGRRRGVRGGEVLVVVAARARIGAQSPRQLGQDGPDRSVPLPAASSTRRVRGSVATVPADPRRKSARPFGERVDPRPARPGRSASTDPRRADDLGR